MPILRGKAAFEPRQSRLRVARVRGQGSAGALSLEVALAGLRSPANVTLSRLDVRERPPHADVGQLPVLAHCRVNLHEGLWPDRAGLALFSQREW